MGDANVNSYFQQTYSHSWFETL